jgi:hypothetical protein
MNFPKLKFLVRPGCACRSLLALSVDDMRAGLKFYQRKAATRRTTISLSPGLWRAFKQNGSEILYSRELATVKS